MYPPSFLLADWKGHSGWNFRELSPLTVYDVARHTNLAAYGGQLRGSTTHAKKELDFPGHDAKEKTLTKGETQECAIKTLLSSHRPIVIVAENGGGGMC